MTRRTRTSPPITPMIASIGFLWTGEELDKLLVPDGTLVEVLRLLPDWTVATVTVGVGLEVVPVTGAEAPGKVILWKKERKKKTGKDLSIFGKYLRRNETYSCKTRTIKNVEGGLYVSTLTCWLYACCGSRSVSWIAAKTGGVGHNTATKVCLHQTGKIAY